MRRLAFLTLVFVLILTTLAHAYTLPEGSVQGLPQNLIVMDENGNSPANGELYIYIENMIPFEVYEKDITLMNVRNDAVYTIYMGAAYNYSSGDVDLLKETLCTLWLDGKQIYTGTVDGKGTPDMSVTPLNLGGVLQSGESRNLHAEFVWQAGMNEVGDTDNTYHGEVSFNWIFSATVDNGGGNTPGGGPASEPDAPTDSTGGGGDSPNPRRPASGGGNSHIPEGNVDTNPDPIKPVDTPEYNVDPNPGEPSVPDIEEQPLLHPDAKPQPDMEEPVIVPDEKQPEIITDKLIDILPIPEDVKTGYRSEILLYGTIGLVSLGAAAVILVVIIYKTIKLRRLKRSHV